jgi:arginase
MGAGAAVLADDGGLQRALERAGWRVTTQRVAATPGADGIGSPEIARQFDLLRQLARDVRGAVARGAFPLVLAGGCLTASATVAGAGARGAVWLDAHADLDTPDDNLSGFLDVMALSVLTGRCWRAQAATIDGFRPLDVRDVALLGVRDVAPYQRAAMEASGVRVAGGAFSAAAARAAIGALAAPLYLHVDLDVVDAREARMNAYAADGGPAVADVVGAVEAAFDHGPVVAACLSAYDARADVDGRGVTVARELAALVARRAWGQAPAGGRRGG